MHSSLIIIHVFVFSSTLIHLNGHVHKYLAYLHGKLFIMLLNFLWSWSSVMSAVKVSYKFVQAVH